MPRKASTMTMATTSSRRKRGRGLFIGWRPGAPLLRPPQSRRRSHCDLRADLDHAIGRNLKIIGRVVGTARQPDEQAILPARHARTHGEPKRTPRKEE